MPRHYRDLLIAVVGLAVLLYVFVERRQRFSFLQQDRLPKWGEYGTILQRERGPLRYIGGAHLSYGGFDVYEQGDVLWLVGPGRRFTPCRAANAMDTMERLIREEAFRRGPPDGWPRSRLLAGEEQFRGFDEAPSNERSPGPAVVGTEQRESAPTPAGLVEVSNSADRPNQFDQPAALPAMDSLKRPDFAFVTAESH